MILVPNRAAKQGQGSSTSSSLPRQQRQKSFPVSVREKISSRVKSTSSKKKSRHIDSADDEEDEIQNFPSREPEACFHLDLPYEYDTTTPDEKHSTDTKVAVKGGKKPDKIVGKKRLLRLLDEFDKKLLLKISYIKEKLGRDMNEKEEKRFIRQERMEIVWDVLDDEQADPEDKDQAATIDEKFNYEEEMKAWKISKEKEEKENKLKHSEQVNLRLKEQEVVMQHPKSALTLHNASVDHESIVRQQLPTHSQLPPYQQQPPYHQPPPYQQMPPPYLQMYPPYQQIPSLYQQVPPNQRMAPSYQHIPSPYQQMPPPYQQMPPPYQQMTPPYQQMPLPHQQFSLPSHLLQCPYNQNHHIAHNPLHPQFMTGSQPPSCGEPRRDAPSLMFSSGSAAGLAAPVRAQLQIRNVEVFVNSFIQS